MKKKNKKIKVILIVIILALIIVAGGVVYIKNHNNTDNEQEKIIDAKVEEEPNEIQEVEYSMHNGGEFVKIGDNIGFINKLNNNTQIINVKEKTAIKVNTTGNELEKIYFDGENIYGVPGHYKGKGIYKIDLQGNITKIYDGECAQLWLTEEKIYFVKQNGFDEINQTPQGSICCMDKSGKNITTIIDNVKNYFKIQDDTIYYTDLSSRALYKANINGENKEKLAEGRIYICDVTDKFLTYIDFADGQAYHVVYLEDNTNHKVGKFGNDVVIGKEGYIYTRKLKDDNNDIEDEATLFKIDYKNKEEKEIWKDTEIGLTTLKYFYNKNVYLMKNKVQKINLNDESHNKEDTDIGYSFFLDGYVYEFKTSEDKIEKMKITNLKNNEKEEIDITYQEAKKENSVNKNTVNTNESNKNENNKQETKQKTNAEIYGWKNESIQGKTMITKEEAINIWKKNISNFGKNNNIINYKDYTTMINISLIDVTPNSLFSQTDNLPSRQANYTRKAWKIETAEEPNPMQQLDVYVDAYTGEIIGGGIYGD